MNGYRLLLGPVGLVGLTCVLVAPLAARADDPPRARAAVAVTSADGVDAFMPVYVLELGAGVLRDAGFDVAPPNAASARLRAIHRTAAECSRAAECVIELAAALRAPMLVLAHVDRDGQRYTLHATTLVVSDGAVEQVAQVELTGTENEIAERLRGAVTALAQRPAPCVVRFDVVDGLHLTMTVDGRPMQPSLQMLFLRGGARQLALSAAGRAAWAGALQCEARHGYRVTVR